MRFLYISLFIFCGIVVAKGQAIFQKSFIEELKQKPLIVVLLEENENYIKYLIKQKDSLIAVQYKNRIAEYNKNIQELLPKYFSFYKSVQYKTMNEVFSIPIEERRNVTFLAYNTSGTLSDRNSWSIIKATMSEKDFQEKYNMPKSDSRSSEITWQIVQYEFYAHTDAQYFKNYYKSFLLENDKFNYAQLELYSYDKSKNKSIISYSKYLPNVCTTKGDLAFFFLDMQCIFNETLNDKKRDKSYYKENGQLLKEKTLIILKDNLNEKLTEEEIKKEYPFDFKIVNREEYDNTIMERNDKQCYVIILPLAKIPISSTGLAAINWYHEIIDANTNKILGMMMPSVILIPGADGSDKIHKKHFKKYIQYTK